MSSSVSDGDGDSFTDSDGSFSARDPFPFSVSEVDRVYWHYVNGLHFARRRRVSGALVQTHLEASLACGPDRARLFCDALVFLGYLVPKKGISVLRLSNNNNNNNYTDNAAAITVFDLHRVYTTRNKLKHYRLCLNNFCRLNSYSTLTGAVASSFSTMTLANNPSMMPNMSSTSSSPSSSYNSLVVPQPQPQLGASSGAIAIPSINIFSAATVSASASPAQSPSKATSAPSLRSGAGGMFRQNSNLTAEIVAERLRDMMQRLQAAFISENGVDYAAMRTSDLFHEFRLCTVDLHSVTDLESLSRESAMAFFLNIYNCMVLQAEVEYGHPGGMFERRRFYSKFSYQIGDESFTMNDIEHGILRGNRLPPGSLFPVFGIRDARRRLAFDSLDARLHFALNCGAKSCPPIRVYNARNVERVLQMAAEGFCLYNVVVDQGRKQVILSKIFQWYRGDFLHMMGGATGNAERDDALLLEYICKFLPAAHPLHECKTTHKVSYAPYNWNQNEDLRVADKVVTQLIQQHLMLENSEDGAEAAGLVWDSGAEVALLYDWASRSVSLSGRTPASTPAFSAEKVRVLVLTDRFIFYQQQAGINASLLFENIESVQQRTIFKEDIVFTTATGAIYTVVGNSSQDVERLLDNLYESVGNGNDGLRSSFSLQLLSEGPQLLDLIVSTLDSSGDKQSLAALRLFYQNADREHELFSSIFARDLKSVTNADLLFRADSLTTAIFGVINIDAVAYLRATVFSIIDEVRAAVDGGNIDNKGWESFYSETAQHLLDMLVNNMARVPTSVIKAWRMAASYAEQAFPGCRKQFMATSVFLRWICPALILPHEWGYTGGSYSGTTRKAMLQISRALQALASGVDGKDAADYEPWILNFANSNRDRFDRLCAQTLGGELSRLRMVSGVTGTVRRSSSPELAKLSGAQSRSMDSVLDAAAFHTISPADVAAAFDVLMNRLLRTRSLQLPTVCKLYRFHKLVQIRGSASLIVEEPDNKPRKTSAPSAFGTWSPSSLLRGGSRSGSGSPVRKALSFFSEQSDSDGSPPL